MMVLMLIEMFFLPKVSSASDLQCSVQLLYLIFFLNKSSVIRECGRRKCQSSNQEDVCVTWKQKNQCTSSRSARGA